MGVARGTNIVRDGLIYGYDTGYGVANNAIATRFYKGKPTTNLVPSAVANGTGVMQRQGSHVETVTYSNSNKYRGREHAYKLTITPTGSNQPYADFLGQYHKSGGSSVGDVYHVSFDYYVKKGLATPGLSVVYANGYKQPNSSSAATLATPTEVLLPDGWTRYMRKATITTAGNTHFRCGLNSNGSEFEVYIDNIKVELQANATPFVDGTRSNTDALIDLVRTTNIDVSNVSFDSTGQPDFDGTDDRIVSSTAINLSSYTAVTYEGVVKAVGLASHDRWLSATNAGDSGFHNPDLAIGTDGQLRYYFGAGGVNTWIAPSGLTIDTTKFNHLVYTFTNAGVVKIYINGTQQHTATYSGSHTFPSSSKFMTGMRFDNNGEGVDGSIPITKVYSKALTADEVMQNYKAYKNRFNL